MDRTGVLVEICTDRGHFENRGEGLVHGDVIRKPLLEAGRVLYDGHHAVENGATGGARCVSLQYAGDLPDGLVKLMAVPRFRRGSCQPRRKSGLSLPAIVYVLGMCAAELPMFQSLNWQAH